MCVVAFVSVCVVRLLDFLLLCVGGVMVSLYSLFSCLVQSVSNMILKKRSYLGMAYMELVGNTTGF
jgi:hypothetical protein